MEFKHKKLGDCQLLVSFNGKKNQLALVKSYAKELPIGININRKRKKQSHWLLWGSLEDSLDDLGKTCVLGYNGYNVSENKALQMFLKASRDVDNFTMKKIRHA